MKSFTTESDALVVTGAVTDITEHKATVHGIANLTPDMVDGADYGIEYSATDIETKETTVWASERDENGRFVINLTKLDYNTKYYYRSVGLGNTESYPHSLQMIFLLIYRPKM